MATDDLKARIAKEIARLRDVRGDYLDLAPPDPLLTEAAARIAELEAQLAAREARLANIAALARKHQAVCGSDGNWAAVEGFATIGKDDTWAA